MPARFMEVVPNLLYRGSAPKKWEIIVLKQHFNIEQIISLDKTSADDIHEQCLENNVQHVIIPINSAITTDKDLLAFQDVTKLIGNKVTYVHCQHGKDRTGLFIAKYRTENGWSCKKAIDEAITFGFGIGLDPKVVNKYIQIIDSSCKESHQHVNIKYYDDKTKETLLCQECGMSKTHGQCKHCFITNALIKNANILYKNVVDEERELCEEKPMTKDDENIGGGSEVSTLFSIPGAIAMTTNQRQHLIKNLCKQANKIIFPIPEEEKVLAKQCVEKLKELVDNILFKVKIKEDYEDILDIIYNPFNENEGITTEQAGKIKQHIDIFIELLSKNMIQVKKFIIFCLDILEKFKSDADVAAMNKSLFDEADNLSKEETIFEEVLQNTENKDFQKEVLESIKTLKKSHAQIKQLINERIIPYLRKDILGEDWTVEIKEELKQDQIDLRKS